MEVLRRVRHRFRSTAHPRNRLTVSKGQYLSYFKFAFVRNPWSRAHSWYWNVMRDENHRRILGIGGEISFGAFLESHAGKGMLRPQTYWLKNLSGSMPLDFIGKFETLDADFEICCRRMNIAPMVLPHTRKSDNNDYREAYDTRLRDLVAEVYREEIAMFGYSF